MTQASPSALAFPAFPIKSEFQRGVDLARKERAMIMVGAEDRVSVAKWFDGTLSREVEFIEFVSPAMISRWLGFMDAKELWEDGEVQRRWTALRSRLDGRASFVVTLAAFPKASVQELTEEIPADPEQLENVRFVFTVGEKRIEAKGSRLAFWQARTRDELKDYRWWIDSPLDPLLTPLEQPDANEAPLPLGDYYQAWYWVDVPLTPEMHLPAGFDLHIVGARRERVAHFPRSVAVGKIEE